MSKYVREQVTYITRFGERERERFRLLLLLLVLSSQSFPFLFFFCFISFSSSSFFFFFCFAVLFSSFPPCSSEVATSELSCLSLWHRSVIGWDLRCVRLCSPSPSIHPPPPISTSSSSFLLLIPKRKKHSGFKRHHQPAVLGLFYVHLSLLRKPGTPFYFVLLLPLVGGVAVTKVVLSYCII